MKLVYFNVDMNNVRQPRNNAVIFNIEFHNVGQRRNNIVNMGICENEKNKPRVKSKIIFLNFK